MCKCPTFGYINLPNAPKIFRKIKKLKLSNDHESVQAKPNGRSKIKDGKYPNLQSKATIYRGFSWF